MSKTKTKRARRELKREGERKIAEHHRKVAKAAEAKTKPTPAQKNKKQKMGSTPTTPAAPAKTPAPVQASQKHDVPFGEYDHILLVGEGDFSFTRSLVEEHGCANVTATSFDTEEEVLAKYPSFSEIQTELSSLTPPVPLHHGIDATKVSSYKHLRCKREDDEEGEEGWDTIAFMFPHTGGLSTDVNRQVRANQALLVDFFKSCLDTPTPKKRLQILTNQQNKVTPQHNIRPFLRMGGKIIVTLFEGEPYTLWNPRDLARHAGLKVIESWKFDWEQYPGYKHVRTLGAIEGGGAWKGEDRGARMYVFEKVPLVADSDEEKEMARLKKVERGGKLPSQKQAMAAAAAADGKRKREGSDEEEEEEDEDEEKDSKRTKGDSNEKKDKEEKVDWRLSWQKLRKS
jgi:25S rRNA (uracil2634-N3)-methyltransferase